MSEFSVEIVVIGAGVVGLAIGRALARAGHEVIIAEAADAIGTGTSSRSSEVIHAGLYYPQGSLKATACVRGRALLYDYAQSHAVAFRRCGKLIVATDAAQLARLDALYDAAQANGVSDVVTLAQAEAQALEPDVRCLAALHSPSTGIIDSHGLMLALQGDFEAAGGMIAFETPVTGGTIGESLTLATGGRDAGEISARWVINAAGHGAPRLLRQMAGFPATFIPPQNFAKGHYFSLIGRQPFRRLVYPLPMAAGLGIHATLDLEGRVRFGPDVEWVSDDSDYAVDSSRAAAFATAIRSYWPALPDGALMPAYSGIRPKIHADGEPMPDFRIDGPDVHGVTGLINLLGIESPGLTAALALAELVLAQVEAA